jgi:hypothetical protein
VVNRYNIIIISFCCYGLSYSLSWCWQIYEQGRWVLNG